MSWLNSDGLYIQMGTEEAALVRGGEYTTLGSHRVTEFMVDLVADCGSSAAILGSATSSTYGTGGYGLELPEGARIEKVEIITMTAATSGGSAVLNIGLVRRDRTTELDYDGLVAAATLASFNAVGETLTLTAGVSTGGALLGTTLANSGIVTVDYDTAAFDTGKIHVRVYWRPVQVTN